MKKKKRRRRKGGEKSKEINWKSKRHRKRRKAVESSGNMARIVARARNMRNERGRESVFNKAWRLPVEFITRLISEQITRLTGERPARDSLRQGGKTSPLVCWKTVAREKWPLYFCRGIKEGKKKRLIAWWIFNDIFWTRCYRSLGKETQFFIPLFLDLIIFHFKEFFSDSERRLFPDKVS